MPVVDKKIILHTIKKMIVKDLGRIDVVLLPHNDDGTTGQFFVVYTVEYYDVPYISSTKLFEGTYSVSHDNTLTLTVNGHTINVKIDHSEKAYEWNFNV